MKKKQRLTEYAVFKHLPGGDKIIKYQCECGRKVLLKQSEVLYKGVTSCGRVGCVYNTTRRSIQRRRILNTRARQSKAYLLWRKLVYSKSHHKCSKCGATGILHAHHIAPFWENEELRFAVKNGAALCTECHDTFHNAYGKKYFTVENFIEFMKDTQFLDNNKYILLNNI